MRTRNDVRVGYLPGDVLQRSAWQHTSEVAGEEPAFRMGVDRIVGGSVLHIEIAPVTGRMTIEQADDPLVGTAAAIAAVATILPRE